MKLYASLSILITGFLLPASSLAAIYSPSEQLKTLQSQRATQEQEYSRSFRALSQIKKELMTERENLTDWLANQIQDENDLLKNIQLVGAPHNVLKIRARHRQLANAKNLFAEQRNEMIAALEEKESEWDSQWGSLKTSQELSRARFNSKERNLLVQIQQEYKLATSSARNVRDARTAWATTQREKYAQDYERKTSRLHIALKRAKTENYLQQENPEVVAQLQRKLEAEHAHQQSMELKNIVEQLGIIGPVNDQLKTSLYLHLFGALPKEEIPIDVSNGY